MRLILKVRKTELYDKYTYTTVSSTMDVASSILSQRISKNNRKSFVVLSDEQTSGVGKPGRSFISPSHSGVYMTICCMSDTKSNYGRVTMAVADIVCKAINQIYGVDTRLKWVNDLVLKRKKIGGILTRIFDINDDDRFLMIGIGININTPSDFIHSKIIGGITKEINPVQKKLLIENIIHCFFEYRTTFNSQFWIDEYVNLSCLIGKKVKLLIGTDNVIGIVVGFSSDGSIIITNKYNGNLKIPAGEILKVIW